MRLHYMFVLLIAVSSICCVRRDTEEGQAHTRFWLGIWRERVIVCRENHLDISRCSTLDEALSFLGKHKLLETSVDAQFLDKDFWNTKYRWEMERLEGEMVIRITSAGRDRSFGTDDDLVTNIYWNNNK
jgi:hypothetical protein